MALSLFVKFIINDPFYIEGNIPAYLNLFLESAKEGIYKAIVYNKDGLSSSNDRLEDIRNAIKFTIHFALEINLLLNPYLLKKSYFKRKE